MAPSDTKYFSGVFGGVSCDLCLLVATVFPGVCFLSCAKNCTLLRSPF